MVSAMTVEHCPSSAWNRVRHRVEYAREHSQGTLTAQPQAFVPLTLESTSVVAKPEPVAVAATSAIRMELRRGAATVTLTWPSELAGDCGVWLRDWLR
jgi:hypothetical protein